MTASRVGGITPSMTSSFSLSFILPTSGPRGLLCSDAVQPGLQLVDLFGMGISRCPEVGACEGEEPVELRARVPRQTANCTVRPLRTVVHRPQVQADESDHRLDLL